MKSVRALASAAVLFAAFPALLLAQAAEAQEPKPNPFFTLLVTLAPLLLFVWFFYWYMKRIGGNINKKHLERSLVHMERVEQQNSEMLEALRRIEGALRDR